MLAEARGTLIRRRGFTPYLKQADMHELEALRFLQADASVAALCAGGPRAGWLGSELITGGQACPPPSKGASR